ncbi:A-kinase anchor protein 8 [Cricetulus griseus]|nr:A-kinase anchor protein 8 [Cricetulus griseus]
MVGNMVRAVDSMTVGPLLQFSGVKCFLRLLWHQTRRVAVCAPHSFAATMNYTGFVQGSETTLQSTYSDTSAQPTWDYGYGTWNSGTNRGYENYDYGCGYGQDDTTNYGYGMTTSHSWEMASSDTNANPSASGSASANSVSSRINQRLDMMRHLETDTIQGGVYSSGGERYDFYEACDSRAVLSERDLYGSCYDNGELDPKMEIAYEGQYDAFRDQFQMRGGDTFGPRAQGWARDAWSGGSMASGYGRMWEDPMGARGQCMPGASRLFSQSIISEYGMFQGMRGGGAFSDGSRFGFRFGNGMKQMRRTWKTWTTADFRTKKKRKQGGSLDEPNSKATRTDCSDNSDSDNDEGTEGEPAEGIESAEAMEKGSGAEGEDEEGKEDGREDGKEDSEKGPLTAQDESTQAKSKLQASKKSQDKQKKRQRDRMVEKIQFVCSLCKYRTFYEDEMGRHLDSKFHKEHFKYVGTKLPKQTADFLQEYVTNKTKKTEELRKTVEDLDGLIQKIYRDQDLTQEIAMEHFVKKVEAAHCAACDLFIPMQFGIIQKHLKTMAHNRNRRLMMEQSKKSSLMVARSILNNKLISKKLERYLKGENPFTDSPEEKEQDEVEAGALNEGTPGEATGLAEGLPAQLPVPLEPAPETAIPPPPPPPEEEGAVPPLGGSLASKPSAETTAGTRRATVRRGSRRGEQPPAEDNGGPRTGAAEPQPQPHRSPANGADPGISSLRQDSDHTERELPGPGSSSRQSAVEASGAAVMEFLFSKSHQFPAHIVKNLKESMAVLEKQGISDKKAKKATEEVSKNLVAMKEIVYGTNKEPQTEAAALLVQELYHSGLLSTLVADLQLIDFEGKKDMAHIFNNILRRQIGTRTPAVEYICTHQNILFMLLKGYESPEIAPSCGVMLRECIRHEPLARVILWSEQFYDFFRYVEMSILDIATDAFATFKDLLTRHKLLSAELLEQHYDRFFSVCGQPQQDPAHPRHPPQEPDQTH